MATREIFVPAKVLFGGMIMAETFKPGAARALFFSTTAFAVSFAVWGLVSALAPTFA